MRSERLYLLLILVNCKMFSQSVLQYLKCITEGPVQELLDTVVILWLIFVQAQLVVEELIFMFVVVIISLIVLCVAHNGPVRGIAVDSLNMEIFSGSSDGLIKVGIVSLIGGCLLLFCLNTLQLKKLL